MSPKKDNWDKAMDYWSSLKSEMMQILKGNNFRWKRYITYGYMGNFTPRVLFQIYGKVPNPKNETNEDKKNSIERSLKYMGLKPDTAIKEIKIDKVFIGSCTKGRIEGFKRCS
ncbi:MAG: hypothetical protein CM1200mP5_3310 [Candidatus Pelagibacterales bacterium]|nr:MAG: hypothetical protein CM1200mP5_3310 [Pelagibacterales bacterium]